MAQEVVLRLRVEGEGDIKNIERELQDTSKAFKEVEKSSERYSGAIKKSNPIVEKLDQATGGLLNTVLDLGHATKAANVSFKGMRTALIATGIGAFVVALGLVVAYWDDIVDYVKQTNERLETTVDISRKLQATLEAQSALLESQIKQRKQQGEGYEDLQNQQIELNKKIQEANQLELDSLRLQLSRLKAEQEELGVWESITLYMGQLFGGSEGLAAASVDTANKRLIAVQELEQAILSAEKKAIDLNIALFDLENPQGDGQQRGEVSSVGQLSPELATRLGLEQTYTDEMAKEYRKRFSNYAALISDQAGADKRAKDEELARERAVNQAKIAVIGQTFGAIAGILGANSKAGKAAAIAQAIINTYQGVTEVWSTPSTLPEPFATISKVASTATVLASGLQAVQSIKSQQLPNIPGASGGAVGGGGGGIVAAQPTFNVIGNTGINQLNDAINERTNEPVKAYVTMSDISRGQSIERNTISEASVG